MNFKFNPNLLPTWNRIRQRPHLWGRSFWAGLILLGLFMFSLIRAGNLYDYQDTMDGGHLPEVDAIVCLAGGRGRIAAAGDLWYRYWELSRSKAIKKVPVLYISGAGPRANWSVVARQLRAGVRGVIQPSDVEIENQSFNTEANARWFANYASRLKLQRAILMTSPYHMKRAHLIFEKVLGAWGNPVQVDTLSVFQEPFEPGEWLSSLHGIHVTLVEYLKWLYYRYFWSS